MAQKAQKVQDPLIVVAIDFGTTYSGYAFQFKHHYTRKDPTNQITAPQSWNDGKNEVMSLKTTTCVLFNPTDPDEEDMFGFQAEKEYIEKCEDNEQDDWYFFKRFKMKLEDGCLKLTSKIQDEAKKEWPAIDVFARSIKCLKKKLNLDIDRTKTLIKDDDILYVLTVPAIWDESSKQFMKEAAKRADIPEKNCVIALEPEAASLFCQHLPVDRFIEGGQAQCSLAAPGTTYMVVDLGGGTADITVHEKLMNGNLREVHPPCGGPWGGTVVDSYFIQLLAGIVKPMAMSDFMHKKTSDYLDMMKEFEIIKRSIDMSNERNVNIKIPSCLNDLSKEHIRKNIRVAIEESDHSDELKVVGDKLRIDSDLAKTFFTSAAKHIVAIMEKCLSDMEEIKDRINDVSLILMVGGFSESPYIQQVVKNRFEGRGGIRILIPDEAGLSVLKGAVVFGRQPESISSRILRYSYGAEITPIFDPSVHDECQRTQDGKRCSNVYLPFATKGTELPLGNKVERIYNTINPFQKSMFLKIFCSDKQNKYTTEPGCKFVGTLSVALNTPTKEPQELHVTFMFGGTDITVSGKEAGKDGKKCETLLTMID